MIPYLNMNCRIVVGPLLFLICHKITIESNLMTIGDTATISLPKNFKKLKDKSVLDYIKAGDKVTIDWGYNGKFTRQFDGFVRQIEAETPLVIHCDDSFFPLKTAMFSKAYKSTTLKQLLSDMLPGYELEVPAVNLGQYVISKSSVFEAIKKIQKDTGLYATLRGKKLTMSFAYQWKAETRSLIYDRQENVRKSDLKWKRKEDVNVEIQVSYIDPAGKKQVVKRGNTGVENLIVKKQKVNLGAGQGSAEQLADAKLNQYAYDGYTGSITGFGVPDTHVGDTLELKDTRNPEKDGFYIIEKVVAEYESAHISRQNTLGRKLDNA